ncbi:type III pantothenate kinase [Peptoniphilus sp. MSJ-1]|uniref:Type III pantothenate kinase n=1 Tax=Peptoniphilus ovalis TaxID=2841503 RepID=A0ABS6FG26_9FIRM|nr:type III pantothenate kinase [Peptoniphilus ovalis]MBU5668921.1 type III pantothenate kinase [Peptoniphilus ovalis]
MLLVIDVGNTSIAWGVYKGDELVNDFRTSTVKTRTSDEYGLIFINTLTHANIDPQEIEDVIISSVVPNLMHTLPSMVIKYFNKKPIVVNTDLKLGLNIEYDNPKEVGADRIVNAVAAIEQYGAQSIIVDIGTAMTFCIVDRDKNYLGGLIMPGIGISAEALFMMTSKLPKIEIIAPEKVIQANTIGAMQSGLYYGYTAMIDGIIERLLKELDWKEEETNIISTGGFSTMLTSDSKFDVIINRYLTLEGLKLIYEMNKE